MIKKYFFKILYSTFIVLIVLSFLFMMLALSKRNVDDSFDDTRRQNFSNNWSVQIDSNDAININLPANLECERNAKIVLNKSLPKMLGTYNCMMIESKRQTIHVYVNDIIRASYTDNSQKIGKSVPSAYLMVPLYNTDANSNVRIELVSNTYYSGNISSIYIGSQMSLILMLIKANMFSFLLICIIAVIGAVCLVCFIMYRNTFDNSIQFIHLFWFSLFSTIWCFSQIKIRQIFIHDLAVAESIGHCCFMLIPLVILLISNYFSNYKHQIFHQSCITIAIISFLTQNIAHTGFGVDYFELQPITQLYTLWILITCIFSCSIETIKGEISGKKLVVIGFLGQTLGIIAEAVLTGASANYVHLSYYIVGSVVFLLAIAMNTFFELRMEQKAKKDADNANKAKSMFLATMSHEIRTPINVVLGMNEMIIRDTTDNTIRDYAINIADAGKSLLSLVNDILDFSKIESGKMEIVCVDYYMKTLLNDLAMMTKTRIGNKNIKLILNVDENIPSKFNGDEVRIKQILTNILTNAVKYTESGTITFSINLVENIDEDSILSFSVKDTGIGLKPENIKVLMSSTFIRFDEQKNRNIEGTGLGISIIRQLLNLMGSELKIESNYGEGSDFSFALKQRVVDKTPLGEIEQKNSSDSSRNRASFMAPSANILAVDDTRTNLLVIKGLLKPYKMSVDTVVSGAECINMCKEKQYDIILMDHMMPEMDGIETLSLLRREGLIGKETRVIALTANAISGAEEMYISNGFDGYLTKPIDVTTLDNCIKNNINTEKIQTIN